MKNLIYTPLLLSVLVSSCDQMNNSKKEESKNGKTAQSKIEKMNDIHRDILVRYGIDILETPKKYTTKIKGQNISTLVYEDCSYISNKISKYTKLGSEVLDLTGEKDVSFSKGDEDVFKKSMATASELNKQIKCDKSFNIGISNRTLEAQNQYSILIQEFEGNNSLEFVNKGSYIEIKNNFVSTNPSTNESQDLKNKAAIDQLIKDLKAIPTTDYNVEVEETLTAAEEYSNKLNNMINLRLDLRESYKLQDSLAELDDEERNDLTNELLVRTKRVLAKLEKGFQLDLTETDRVILNKAIEDLKKSME